MILILQVEYSIGYLKNVEVHEYIENSVSILFLIKSIKKGLGLFTIIALTKLWFTLSFFPWKFE